MKINKRVEEVKIKKVMGVNIELDLMEMRILNMALQQIYFSRTHDGLIVDGYDIQKSEVDKTLDTILKATNT